MIPEFPKFKLLELTDRDEVNKITSHFSPYSDFNFTSMWSWNLIDEIAISCLNNNLVVRFTDYITNDPFYSFIGNQKVDETASKLLDFSAESGLPAQLRLLPEVSLEGIDKNKFEITEDRNHFDYVYSIGELRDYAGGKFSKKRNHVSGFLKKFPHVTSKIISLKDPKIVKSVLNLFDKWHIFKLLKKTNSGLHDLAALKRLLQGVEIFDLIPVGVYIDEELVALFISEQINEEYALAHIMKADASVDDGLYAYLMQKNAEILSSFGLKLFNYEQDLGFENLRIAKTRFNPTAFLRKNSLSYAHKG